MTVTKKAILTLFLLFGMLAVSSLIVIMLPDDSLFGQSSVLVCYLILVSVIFYFYIRWAIIKSATRDNLLWSAALFALLFLIRGARYIAFVEMNQVWHLLWYFYYGPILFIPYFSFRAAFFIGNADERSSPKWHMALFAISLILLIFVCTNDLHQWVFHVQMTPLALWANEYTYGPLYYMVYAWISILLLGSLIIMYHKCRIAACRKQIWAPLISSMFGVFCLTMVMLDKIPRMNGHLIIQFPETFCFTVAAAWVCCIQIGLVPANQSYTALFSISSIRAMISDKSGNIIYRSENITEGENQTNIQTQRRAIRGGFVSWQTDVTRINQINEELDSIHQQLKEETELLRLENELKEKNKMLEAKNAVYDAIAVRVLPQSTKISELSTITDLSSQQRTHNLYRICLYGCYIKRMSNLMLIAAQQSTIGEMEFALAVGESMNYIRRFGIPASVFAEESDRSYGAAQVVAAYETFEQYVEQALPHLKGIQATIVQDVCKLTLECSEERILDRIGNSAVEWDDGTAFITISVAERRTQE